MSEQLAAPTVSARPGPPTGRTAPIYRVRSRGRVEIRTERGNWMRVRLVPVPGIRLTTPTKPAA